ASDWSSDVCSSDLARVGPGSTAGNETTRHTLSLGLLALFEHADERARLAADPALAAPAADDLLRWAPPPPPAHGGHAGRRGPGLGPPGAPLPPHRHADARCARAGDRGGRQGRDLV